jgi:ribonuclease-3
MENNIFTFLKKYGIVSKNKVYLQALIHSSYGKINKVEDYEKLELLGDAVIELSVSNYLYQNSKNKSVGEISKERMLITQGSTEASCFKSFNIQNLILVSNIPSLNIPDSILEDVYESIIGAIYIDKGFKEADVFIKKTLLKFYQTNTNNVKEDFKTKLQELSFKKFKLLPIYKAKRIEDKYEVEL